MLFLILLLFLYILLNFYILNVSYHILSRWIRKVGYLTMPAYTMAGTINTLKFPVLKVQRLHWTFKKDAERIRNYQYPDAFTNVYQVSIAQAF